MDKRLPLQRRRSRPNQHSKRHSFEAHRLQNSQKSSRELAGPALSERSRQQRFSVADRAAPTTAPTPTDAGQGGKLPKSTETTQGLTKSAAQSKRANPVGSDRIIADWTLSLWAWSKISRRQATEQTKGRAVDGSNFHFETPTKQAQPTLQRAQLRGNTDSKPPKRVAEGSQGQL